MAIPSSCRRHHNQLQPQSGTGLIITVVADDYIGFYKRVTQARQIEFILVLVTNQMRDASVTSRYTGNPLNLPPNEVTYPLIHYTRQQRREKESMPDSEKQKSRSKFAQYVELGS